MSDYQTPFPMAGYKTQAFEAKPHVCCTCNGENFHVNMMWINTEQWWTLDPECPAWCRDCDDQCHIQFKETAK